MPVTHTLTQGFTRGSESISKEISKSVGAEAFIDENVADAVTNGLFALVLDVSQLASVFIVSDKALTLKTNSSGSPADTIALVANEPVLWYSSNDLACPLGTDVTALYVTNASGATARLQCRFGYDPTV